MTNQLQFSQGDVVTLNLNVTDGLGNPINLTGATFSTQILGPTGVIAVFGNSQHTIVTAADGTFTLALSTSDTQACNNGNNKDVLTTVTIGGSPIIYRGIGILNVYPPVPLQ